MRASLFKFLYAWLQQSSAERSFSCLKRIKNYFRTTLSESKVDHSLLCIGNDHHNIINTENIIDMPKKVLTLLMYVFTFEYR